MKIIALALFAIAVTLVFGADTIGKQYDLSKVVSRVAVEERYGEKDGDVQWDMQYFEPLKTKFSAPDEVSKLCKAIEGSEAVKAGQGPFIGHLCHFVLVDNHERILGMVSILNYNCLCDISGAHRDAEGRIVADYGKKAFGFTSREVVRSFYERLKKKDSGYMKKLDAVYADTGKTAEGLLFGNANGE